MIKLFIPALIGFALLAPTVQAQPSPALRSATSEISRDAGFELVAAKKKTAKKPAVKKTSSAKKTNKATRTAA